MVTTGNDKENAGEKPPQMDNSASFLRAARAGNLEKVLEYLKGSIDINTSNANGLNALHLASKEGHVPVVKELLARGAEVNAATKKGNTALHIASLAGQAEVVKVLVERGANVNVQSQNGFTPLYMAAQENHDAVVRFLLANTANQSLATEDGFTPLAVALQQGHDKVVAVLLENDAKGKVRLPALHIASKKDDTKAAALLLQNEHNPDVTSKSGFTPLHIAAHYGNSNIAALLLEKGADVNFPAKHQITPLHVAAKWGKANMVKLLLEKGAKLDASTRDGLTPLHCAARSGHDGVVEQLLEKGAPLTAKTKNGLAPLHMASQGDHVDSAKTLLTHKAPVDDITVDYLTALHVAAHCGHVGVAKLLLDKKADANARALNGFTPLHIACKKNRIKVVELLLRHGASIEATTESGLTPLHVASFMGCMNIVIYLIQHGANADVPTVRGETPLHLAARANQTDIVRILLRNGAQVDTKAREQQTPLHIAARLGNTDIVGLLLQHGAHVDSATKDQYTALHIAAKEGQEDVVNLLLDHGASVTATTKKGFTPLHLAAKYGNLKVAKLLLQKEAPVDAQGKNGVTPLHVAAHYDHNNVALLLLEQGASPHAAAKNGYTPLHIAAKKNQMDIGTTLLEYGAKTNAESKAGFTPLHLAAQEGHSEMAGLLIEHGANVNAAAKNGLTPLHLCAQDDRVNVAAVLAKHNCQIDPATQAGYTPLHVACHFGQMNMIKFLLQHGSDVNATTSHGYTPLHQAAQQGHTMIINLLLENRAQPNATTNQGQTALSIAQKLGYISVIETLKVVTETTVTTTTTVITEEKYKVVAPETMHETFMSDSEDEAEQDNMMGDHSFKYLTADEMKSLGDDSLPIDVTRDERLHEAHVAREGHMAPSAVEEDRLSPSHLDTSFAKAAPDNVEVKRTPVHAGGEGKLKWKTFLVSFMVDARGGAMRGCRHSGVRVIIPPRRAAMPMRVTCRFIRKERLTHPPPLMEGEACAARVIEMGPAGAKFLGPVVIEVPHFASLRGKEREIVILRSDNGETWKEHTLEATEDAVSEVLNGSFDAQELSAMQDFNTNRVTRILTSDFPQYFAIVCRNKQEVHSIGPEGGMVSSTVVPQVQAIFPDGALTKKIKVGLQAQPVHSDLVTRLLGNRVAVSPIVTVEPRRRKFHKPITLTIPMPQAAHKGMTNQYSGDAPTLRLLCSITGGQTKAQWEDVTGSTPLTFVNDCVSFTTTVSARFWLIDCRQISEVTKFATELYQEAVLVPFMAKFVVFAKRHEPLEAQLRVFCMTDDREEKTLETQEHFTEVAKSRDVEVLEGKQQYLEFAGNLVPITKSGEQLSLTFEAFKENRIPFNVRVKDMHQEPLGRLAFMKEPRGKHSDGPQTPVCNLNIKLPEVIEYDNMSLERKYGFVQETGMGKQHEMIHRADLHLTDIAKQLADDWPRLAQKLDIPSAEIDQIREEVPNDREEQAITMLRIWVQRMGPRATGNSLENALQHIGRDDIVRKCMANIEVVTDDVEKAVAKVHLTGPTAVTTVTTRTVVSSTTDERDIMKDAESAEDTSSESTKAKPTATPAPVGVIGDLVEALKSFDDGPTVHRVVTTESGPIITEIGDDEAEALMATAGNTQESMMASPHIREVKEVLPDGTVKHTITSVTTTTIVQEEGQPQLEISAKHHESEAAASDADTSQVSVSSLPEDEGTVSSGHQHAQGVAVLKEQREEENSGPGAEAMSFIEKKEYFETLATEPVEVRRSERIGSDAFRLSQDTYENVSSEAEVSYDATKETGEIKRLLVKTVEPGREVSEFVDLLEQERSKPIGDEPPQLDFKDYKIEDSATMRTHSVVFYDDYDTYMETYYHKPEEPQTKDLATPVDESANETVIVSNDEDQKSKQASTAGVEGYKTEVSSELPQAETKLSSVFGEKLFPSTSPPKEREATLLDDDGLEKFTVHDEFAMQEQQIHHVTEVSTSETVVIQHTKDSLVMQETRRVEEDSPQKDFTGYDPTASPTLLAHKVPHHKEAQVESSEGSETLRFDDYEISKSPTMKAHLVHPHQDICEPEEVLRVEYTTEEAGSFRMETTHMVTEERDLSTPSSEQSPRTPEHDTSVFEVQQGRIPEVKRLPSVGESPMESAEDQVVITEIFEKSFSPPDDKEGIYKAESPVTTEAQMIEPHFEYVSHDKEITDVRSKIVEERSVGFDEDTGMTTTTHTTTTVTMDQKVSDKEAGAMDISMGPQTVTITKIEVCTSQGTVSEGDQDIAEIAKFTEEVEEMAQELQESETILAEVAEIEQPKTPDVSESSEKVGLTEVKGYSKEEIQQGVESAVMGFSSPEEPSSMKEFDPHQRCSSPEAIDDSEVEPNSEVIEELRTVPPRPAGVMSPDEPSVASSKEFDPEQRAFSPDSELPHDIAVFTETVLVTKEQSITTVTTKFSPQSPDEPRTTAVLGTESPDRPVSPGEDADFQQKQPVIDVSHREEEVSKQPKSADDVVSPVRALGKEIESLQEITESEVPELSAPEHAYDIRTSPTMRTHAVHLTEDESHQILHSEEIITTVHDSRESDDVVKKTDAKVIPEETPADISEQYDYRSSPTMKAHAVHLTEDETNRILHAEEYLEVLRKQSISSDHSIETELHKEEAQPDVPEVFDLKTSPSMKTHAVHLGELETEQLLRSDEVMTITHEQTKTVVTSQFETFSPEEPSVASPKEFDPHERASSPEALSPSEVKSGSHSFTTTTTTVTRASMQDADYSPLDEATPRSDFDPLQRAPSPDPEELMETSEIPRFTMVTTKTVVETVVLPEDGGDPVSKTTTTKDVVYTDAGGQQHQMHTEETFEEDAAKGIENAGFEQDDDAVQYSIAQDIPRGLSEEQSEAISESSMVERELSPEPEVMQDMMKTIEQRSTTRLVQFENRESAPHVQFHQMGAPDVERISEEIRSHQEKASCLVQEVTERAVEIAATQLASAAASRDLTPAEEERGSSPDTESFVDHGKDKQSSSEQVPKDSIEEIAEEEPAASRDNARLKEKTILLTMNDFSSSLEEEIIEGGSVGSSDDHEVEVVETERVATPTESRHPVSEMLQSSGSTEATTHAQSIEHRIVTTSHPTPFEAAAQVSEHAATDRRDRQKDDVHYPMAAYEHPMAFENVAFSESELNIRKGETERWTAEHVPSTEHQRASTITATSVETLTTTETATTEIQRSRDMFKQESRDESTISQDMTQSASEDDSEEQPVKFREKSESSMVTDVEKRQSYLSEESSEKDSDRRNLAISESDGALVSSATHTSEYETCTQDSKVSVSGASSSNYMTAHTSTQSTISDASEHSHSTSHFSTATPGAAGELSDASDTILESPIGPVSESKREWSPEVAQPKQTPPRELPLHVDTSAASGETNSPMEELLMRYPYGLPCSGQTEQEEMEIGYEASYEKPVSMLRKKRLSPILDDHGSTPDADSASMKRSLGRGSERDDMSVCSLQEFERLEAEMAASKNSVASSIESSSHLASSHRISSDDLPAALSSSQPADFERIERELQMDSGSFQDKLMSAILEDNELSSSQQQLAEEAAANASLSEESPDSTAVTELQRSSQINLASVGGQEISYETEGGNESLLDSLIEEIELHHKQQDAVEEDKGIEPDSLAQEKTPEFLDSLSQGKGEAALYDSLHEVKDIAEWDSYYEGKDSEQTQGQFAREMCLAEEQVYTMSPTTTVEETVSAGDDGNTSVTTRTTVTRMIVSSGDSGDFQDVPPNIMSEGQTTQSTRVSQMVTSDQPDSGLFHSDDDSSVGVRGMSPLAQQMLEQHHQRSEQQTSLSGSRFTSSSSQDCKQIQDSQLLDEVMAAAESLSATHSVITRTVTETEYDSDGNPHERTVTVTTTRRVVTDKDGRQHVEEEETRS